MRFLKRDDNILSRIDFDSETIYFGYKFYAHAILFLVFSFAIAATVWYFKEEIIKLHFSIYWFCIFLATALLIGTILTICTRCTLEINRSKQTVNYSWASLFQQSSWKKDFVDFKEIRLYRPAASSGQAGRSATIKVLLKTNDGDELPLGLGLFGTSNIQKAKELAQQLAKIMSLAVIEEPSVQRKY